jgi:hypothetical protein
MRKPGKLFPRPGDKKLRGAIDESPFIDNQVKLNIHFNIFNLNRAEVFFI